MIQLSLLLIALLAGSMVASADDAKPASAKGKLLSERAVVKVSGTCGYDSPETHLNLVRGPVVPDAFHTGNEKNPWVTLKLPAPAQIRSFEVINRPGPNMVRAATLTVSFSPDGKAWKQIWSAEGKALDKWEVILPDDPAKNKNQYVKLELKPEKNEYFHLSRVSIYGN